MIRMTRARRGAPRAVDRKPQPTTGRKLAAKVRATHRNPAITFKARELRRIARSIEERIMEASRPVAGVPAANYESRIRNREFEPTAVRAREIARQRGITLHELAHELGYAGAPPRTRTVLDFTTMRRTDLAHATGYTPSEISRTFARRHPPTLTKLGKIAAAYGALMDDVLEKLGW